MKKLNFLSQAFLIILLINFSFYAKLHAADYTINFTASGAATTINSVEVYNFSQNFFTTLPVGAPLILTGTTDAPLLISDNWKLKINPNPATDKAYLTYTSDIGGNADIHVFGLDGRTIIRVSRNLNAGINRFTLSLPKGFFLIHLNENGIVHTSSIISQIDNPAYIQFDENLTSNVHPIQKTKSSNYNLPYRMGDNLLLKGFSGDYCTIVTLIPTGDTTVNFNFVECRDADGTNYPVVQIGKQVWMAQNLKTTKYRNGDVIPNVTNNSTWSELNTGAWCHYNNEATNGNKYGKLYNWYAVNDSRNIAPVGWRISTDNDWLTLENYLMSNGFGNDGQSQDYKIAKSLASTTDWALSTESGTIGNEISQNNRTGFTALPGGYRNSSGQFNDINFKGSWWRMRTDSWKHCEGMNYNENTVWNSYGNIPYSGVSVRCVKQSDTDLPVVKTSTITNITPSSATSGGDITSDGGFSVTSRGICWNTTGNPSINDHKTIDGAGSGSFVSIITDLTLGTTYYIRAFATNSEGTAYGNEISFTTPLLHYTAVTPRPWYIIGLGDGIWNNSLAGLGASIFPLSVVDGYVYNEQGDGIFTYTGYFDAAKGFKLIRDPGSWDEQWGMKGGAYAHNDLGSSNIKLTESGYYTINLNSINYTLTITPTVAPANTYNQIGIIGDFLGWNPEIAMSAWSQSNNHFWYKKIDVYENIECRLIANSNLSISWGNNTFPWGIGVNNGNNIPIKAGSYMVMFDDIKGSYYFKDLLNHNTEIIFKEKLEDGTLGDFTTQSVTGDQFWVSDANGYALMTGYVSATNQNLANEDWLISPQIDLTNVTTAHFTFDHVARYFEDPANEATVWISDDYVSGLPSTANWTQVGTSPIRDPGTWKFNNSGQQSLTAYAGKKIHIAFKYISNNTKAGSWEIKNFEVLTGEAVELNANYGLGTATSPYTVLGAASNQNNNSSWTKGTIVGYVWYIAGNGNSFYFNGDTCTQVTNILVADSGSFLPNPVVAVQLPEGVVRSGLNLKNNKSLIGKKVTLYGENTTYFGIAGLKNTSYFKLEDGTTGGNKPFDPSSAIYYETFASNLGKFTTQNVTGGEIWTFNSTYKCAYMTGYVSSQNKANEDWLISSEIDLTGKSNIALAFDHVFRYGAVPANEASVWVSENYSSGLPSTATWTQITTNFTNASTWDFYNTGDISLNAYAGKKIRIALVYKSTSSKAGTWEVKNFSVLPAKINVPELTTSTPDNISSTGAKLGGTITSDGGSAIIARGVCWNTTGNPTINDSKTSDGAGIGLYTSEISGLSPNTTYYIRAYATNSFDTGYGSQEIITTSSPVPASFSFSFTDAEAPCSDVSGLLTTQQTIEIYNAAGLTMNEFNQIYTLTNSGEGAITQTVNDYLLNWTLTGNQIWNKLITASPATFSATAIFTPSDMTRYPKINVSISRRFTKPASLNIPSTQLMNMFWYSDDTVSPYPYIKHTIRRPEINENDPNLAVFENNLNQVFTQTINKSLMGFSNYEYYFLPSQPNHPDGTSNGTTLTVSADGKQLLYGSEVVATINPYIANTGDILSLNKNSNTAKRLLNYDKEFLKARIGIRSAYCANIPQYKIPVTINDNPYFDVVFVRPINVDPYNDQKFIDGSSFGEPGTFIEIRKMVNLSDWRNGTGYVSTFAQYPWYYQYYGVYSITPDLATIKTDLNGTKVPIYNFPALLVAYEPSIPGVNPPAPYGYLTYRNNGGVFGVEFNLFVPVTIEYVWGSISTIVQVPVLRIIAPIGIKHRIHSDASE